jgi:hypothetical protein
LCVPFVFEVGEERGRVLGAEREVSFRVVDFVFLRVEAAGYMVQFGFAGGVGAVFGGPAGVGWISMRGWWREGENNLPNHLSNKLLPHWLPFFE